METVSKEVRLEIVNAVRQRYDTASKSEKGHILKEFVAISGYHRKHAIRLLNRKRPVVPNPPVGSQRIYDEAVKNALLILWETADRICGKRLKAAIPLLVEAMERNSHLLLEENVRTKIFSISPATIDRILKQVRQIAGSRKRRRLSKRASKEIPVKTFADWKEPLPGFLEIDFVVHGGGSMSGEYLHSFVATDVCSGWVEAVPLLAREQTLVVEGLKQMRRQMPVSVLGINSDNDSAFINETLLSYCQKESIAFTRSRAHHKNDQAWIEQKNGAVIRRMIGHERLSGIVAGQAMAQFFQALRLYVNFFQPSFKLRERIREGCRIKKTYYPPATPCDRLLAHPSISELSKAALLKQRSQLDPVELLHRIRQGQSALAALSKGDPSSGPDRENLSQFLAQLPRLWQQGEVRPTHRKEDLKLRYWRTREDPFKNAWPDILHLLQENPDITAKHLLGKLDEKYPGQYDPNLLRTLQRRIGEWRRSMARKLVFSGIPEQNDISPLGSPRWAAAPDSVSGEANPSGSSTPFTPSGAGGR